MNNLTEKIPSVNFRNVVESISDYFLVLDSNLDLIYFNKAVEDLFESRSGLLQNKSFFEIQPELKGSKAEEIYRKVLSTGKSQCFVQDFKIHNRIKSLEISVYPSPDGLVIYGKDITEFKIAEESGRRSEILIRTTLDNLLEGCAVFAPDWRYLYVNEANAVHAHHTREELLGNKLTEIFPGVENTLIFKAYERVMKKRVPENIVSDYHFADGTESWFEIKIVPIPEGIFILSSDITELKKNEEIIKTSLKEKEVLLQELYHRTKNNMQVISSLFKLEAAASGDKQFLSIANQMNNRIQAISLVHQKLFQSNNLSMINLAEYISDLLNLLISSYSAAPEKIHVEKDLQAISVLLDTAVPCGLIINELISNSLKYAFPGNREGSIAVRLSSIEKEEIELIIEDNGIGFKEQDIWKNSKLGLQLFKMIAEDQLMADISLNRSKGTSWKIIFKDTHYSRRV